jgi:hypothetical protein
MIRTDSLHLCPPLPMGCHRIFRDEIPANAGKQASNGPSVVETRCYTARTEDRDRCPKVRVSESIAEHQAQTAKLRFDRKNPVLSSYCVIVLPVRPGTIRASRNPNVLPAPLGSSSSAPSVEATHGGPETEQGG